MKKYFARITRTIIVSLICPFILMTELVYNLFNSSILAKNFDFTIEPIIKEDEDEDEDDEKEIKDIFERYAN